MANKLNLIIYAFVGVCILQIALTFFSRYLTDHIVELHDEYVMIKDEVVRFEHFEDSLAGNEHFRRQLLDTIQNADALRQVKQNIGKDLKQKLIDFHKQYSNQKSIFTVYKVVEGLKMLLNVLFVCFGLPLFIHLVRTR